MIRQELLEFAMKGLRMDKKFAEEAVEAFLFLNQITIGLPGGIKKLQDYFPGNILVGGSFARFVEANTKMNLFNPRLTKYEDIDIFVFHNITRQAMESILKECFVDAVFEYPNEEHTQYKMPGIRKVIKFTATELDGSKQKYDLILIDPKQVHFDSSITEWFMQQQASELSQICLEPDFSTAGYQLQVSRDLKECFDKTVHLRADKCTDEFRKKLRKQASDLGYKIR